MNKIRMAAHTYTLLTIGDGLVAQVPSLMLSVATAMIVTRVSRSEDMGTQLLGQLFGSPRALAVAGIVLGSMGLVPGMPNVAFLSLAGGCGLGAWLIARNHRNQARVGADGARTRSRPGWRPGSPEDGAAHGVRSATPHRSQPSDWV